MSQKLSIALIFMTLLIGRNAVAHEKNHKHKNDFSRAHAEREHRRRHDNVGIFVESSFFRPGFYYGPDDTYTPYYASPSLITPTSPPAYSDQGNMQLPEPHTWGYCLNPAGYYPYVRECSSTVLQVDPQPLDMEPGYWYYCTNPGGYYPYVRECSAIWKQMNP